MLFIHLQPCMSLEVAVGDALENVISMEILKVEDVSVGIKNKHHIHHIKIC